MFYLKTALTHMYVQKDETCWIFLNDNAMSFASREEAKIVADAYNKDPQKFGELLYIDTK